MTRAGHKLLFCLLFYLKMASTIKVFRNILEVGDTESLGGATLKNVPDNVAITDLTICMRFNLKLLGGWESAARLLTISDWKTEAKDVDFQFMFLGAWYPETFFGFGHPQGKGSWGSYLLTDTKGSTNVWTPNKWTALCLSYRKRDAFLRVTMDGATMSINRSDPNLVNTVIPPDFLTKIYFGQCSYNFTGGCTTPGALLSDFNIWSRALSEQESKDWTSCNTMMKGDLVDWNTAKWETISLVEEQMTQDGICKPRRPGNVIFPEKRNFTATMDLCRKMKSNVAVAYTVQEQQELDNLYLTTFTQSSVEASYWLGFWDEITEEKFESVIDGAPLSSHEPWYYGEPNGARVENCVVVWAHRGAWNDVNCNNRFSTICNFEEAPYLKIRGLCYGSVFDSEYSWTINFINGRHSFSGFKNTILFWNNDTSVWQLSLLDNTKIYATLDNEEYPLGTFQWTIYNEPCYNGKETTVDLSLNTCTENEFNCEDGTCIDITDRCNGKTDCPDKTDEIGCSMVKIDESYIKDMPAPSKIVGSLSKINVSVDVLAILEINEVDSYLALQFELRMTWFDPRITLNNLKPNDNLNTVNTNDKALIWMPEVIFYNTIVKEESKDDSKSYITVKREGKYTESKLQNQYNIHTFKGSENPMTISRVYSTHFICDFDMGSYPFDTQKCRAIFIMKGNTGFFAQLVVEELAYSGPIDLTQYYVRDWQIWESFNTNGTIGASIQVEIALGRRLLNELLTTYLPTMLICIVSFCTNYFKPFFFEAIVTVNLTSLLVLTTLFISVSGNLPKTAYVKMIDVWLIFVLCVPFVETILHTLNDYLREEEEFTVNHHGGTIQVDNRDKKGVTQTQVMAMPPINHSGKVRNIELIARDELLELSARKKLYQHLRINNAVIRNVCDIVLKFGIPTVFVGFSVCYFIIGLAKRG